MPRRLYLTPHRQMCAAHHPPPPLPPSLFPTRSVYMPAYARVCICIDVNTHARSRRYLTFGSALNKKQFKAAAEDILKQEFTDDQLEVLMGRGGVGLGLGRIR